MACRRSGVRAPVAPPLAGGVLLAAVLLALALFARPVGADVDITRPPGTAATDLAAGGGPSATPLSDGAEAMDVCTSVMKSSGYGSGADSVLRAEQSTAGKVAEWQEKRHAPEISLVSRFRTLPVSEPVTVCIYAGRFAGSRPAPLDGIANQPYDALRLIVYGDGQTVLDAIGYQGQMDTPGEWSKSRGG
jgi:hypothetical protein